MRVLVVEDNVPVAESIRAMLEVRQFATNVVTVTNSSGQTLGPGAGLTLTTLGANTCQIDQWNVANSTWYRIQ